MRLKEGDLISAILLFEEAVRVNIFLVFILIIYYFVKAFGYLTTQRYRSIFLRSGLILAEIGCTSMHIQLALN